MAETNVLYNDTCPICSREIKHYDRVAKAEDLSLDFAPLSTEAETWGFDSETAASKLHVKQGDQILSGFDAFIAIWKEIPRYRWLAKIGSLPLLRPVLRFLYDRVIAPLLFAMHKRRVRKGR